VKRPVLWSVSVTTSPLAEEAVTEWLAGAFGQQPASYTDLDTGRTVVRVFCRNKPNWSRARQLELKNRLRQMKHFGLDIGPARISLARLWPENWAESWKRHFRPISISAGARSIASLIGYEKSRVVERLPLKLPSGLLIKPSWCRLRPLRNQAPVILNPGLSFGTGQHPTTKFCLDQMVDWRRSAVAQSFLDLGTGSGILAIAAARLGYSPVAALDSDPEAIRFARANIRLNPGLRQIRIWQTDVGHLPRRAGPRYSLVCANLTADLLLNESERIVARLAKNGLLVLAGILATEFALVRQQYQKAGLHPVRIRTEGEWRSGSFRWSAL